MINVKWGEQCFRICKSPLCSNKIWKDGHKFEGGIFCDKYCKEEWGFFDGKTPERKAMQKKGLDKRYKESREKKLDMLKLDYQFEFNK